MAKPQHLEVEHLINDGAKDWSHRKGLAFAASVVCGLLIIIGCMHACYQPAPRAPAAARGSK